MTIREAFHCSELLAEASSASFALLAACTVLKRIKKGEYIFQDREEVQTIYIIVSGAADLHKMTGTGERKVLFIYGKGQTVNIEMLSSQTSSVNCQMIQEGMVLCLGVSGILTAMEKDMVLTRAALDAMSLKIRRLYRQLKNTSSSLRGDRRLAAKLWKLAADFGVEDPEGCRISLDLTVTYLADMTGSKRETVSRQLKMLTEMGLVLSRKNQFIIPDRNSLKKIL